MLSNNQALVIDARTNSINYMLEILPNGKIVKQRLTPKEKENIKNNLHLEHLKTNMFNNTIYKQSNIRQWNKSKIPYEQQVEKINLQK